MESVAQFRKPCVVSVRFFPLLRRSSSRCLRSAAELLLFGSAAADIKSSASLLRLGVSISQPFFSPGAVAPAAGIVSPLKSWWCPNLPCLSKTLWLGVKNNVSLESVGSNIGTSSSIFSSAAGSPAQRQLLFAVSPSMLSELAKGSFPEKAPSYVPFLLRLCGFVARAIFKLSVV
ncbi:hypothetical protein PIB30_061052 [Stylosanthes scabra]|uniref:Uncharacterized protein n=1 Tax=Stylosanthes scabra TaxID=79078 RepID=A0ABU6TKJ7_9FABA|nr:hypothetical protein [Stylosanthes scabra]